MTDDKPSSFGVIVLVRHGKPELDLAAKGQGWVSPARMCDLIDRYQNVRLDPNQQPPAHTCAQTSAADFALVSPLTRCVDTFETLELDCPHQLDSIFAEAPMLPPRLSSRWQWLRLPVPVWMVVLRLFWFFGVSDGVERYSQSKERAKQAVLRLEAAAKDHQTVLLVGHGMFNHLLVKALIKRGWTRSGKSPHSYWAAQTLMRD